jgi:cell division protein ZipA
MSQLRWSLLILGAAFIAVLGWWEWRRPRQGRAGGAEPRAAPRAPAQQPAAPRAPREPPLQLPEIHARGSFATADLPVLELARDPENVPVPVLTAAQDAAPTGRAEPAGHADPVVGELPAIELESGAVSAPRERPCEQLPELPAAPAPRVEWPPDTERRVVALRLVAMQPARFAGRSVRQALAAEGFVLGKFAIFHKPDEEQRAVLSAASLTRPGTFDAQTMDSQHYGGLSLFAVVPGPHPLPETFEELVATARSINQRLQGVLQDEAGSPLTPARIASLREHLGRETPA